MLSGYEEIGDAMADEELAEEEAPKKKSKLPLIIGLVLMLALGGGGFFAVYSGQRLSDRQRCANLALTC